MPNHKGPPVASILSTTKKGDHEYAILKINNQPIITTKKAEQTLIASTVLCTFQVPFHISIPEFLEFVAPVDSFVSHYRIIRYDKISFRSETNAYF
jgi:BRCA1-associated protein